MTQAEFDALAADVADITGVPPGGVAGKVLVKNSATDYDLSWGDGGSVLTIENVPVTENGTTIANAVPGDIIIVNDPRITANHVVKDIRLADPTAIPIAYLLPWTTGNGTLVVSGICIAATTASIDLVLKSS